MATATIASAEFITSSVKGTPGLEIVHMLDETVPGLNHEYGQGRIAKTTFWLSPAAADRSVNNVCLIADHLGIRDALNAATKGAKTPEAFGKSAAGVLKGQTGAFIFSAEDTWIANDDGGYNDSPWVKPLMNTRGVFVRSLDRKEELIEEFSKRGPDFYHKKKERPGGAAVSGFSTGEAAGADDGEW